MYQGGIEVNKVYQEPCLDTLKRLPDNCVDLIIADPPYQIEAGGGGGSFGEKNRSYHKGVKTLSHGFENIVLDECKRICKLFNAYVFCNKNQVLQILKWADENNLNIDILCYHKTNPIPTVNSKYLSDTEYIIFMREQGAFLGGSYATKKKYFLQENGKSEFDHPTVKPLNIIRTLILNSSKEGDIVFDPFMGSGTTAVASIMEKRNYLGSEIDEKYCKIIQQRIDMEVKQFNLF